MNKQHIIDNLKKFGSEFQIKCISGLVSDRPFMERLADIVEPDFFESDAHQWIVKESVKYFLEYKDLPTLNVFKIKMDNLNNEMLKASIVNNLKVIYQKMNDGDLTFIKEQFLEFCKNQKLKNAINDAVDLLVTGEYEKIKTKVDEALKAGMERNLGHSYDEEIDKRMTLMARNSIPTNWQVIDSIMDGGLGPGELGVVTACAGSGKCVGPNTEIEIAYEELGIEITGNSGSPHVIWISPYKKYDFDDKQLLGWQIGNIIYELEKLTMTSESADK